MKITKIAANTNNYYHISNSYFKSFDPKQTAQGLIWFSNNKEDLIKNLHGASINTKEDIYLYICNIDSNKIAGWEEYDKLGLWELEQKGYDTINLDNDIAVLDHNIITIIEIEKIN